MTGTGELATLERRLAIMSGTVSDAHTWNLVFLQLVLEELGYGVVNLGPCVPIDLLASECRSRHPDLVVLSSVNGHGHQDGMRAITLLRAFPELADVPFVIGGKLGIGGPDRLRAHDLVVAGFDVVFQDAPGEVDAFRSYVRGLPAGVLS